MSGTWSWSRSWGVSARPLAGQVDNILRLAFFWSIHRVYLVRALILGGMCQATSWPDREYVWAGLLLERPHCPEFLVTGLGSEKRLLDLWWPVTVPRNVWAGPCRR